MSQEVVISMFAAIIRQMKCIEYETYSIQGLRNSIAQHLEQHSEWYRPSISLNVDNNRNDTEPFSEVDILIQQIQNPHERQEHLWLRYLQRLREGAWGDHVVLQATADMTDLTIHVLSFTPGHSAGHDTIIAPRTSTDVNFDDQNALHLGFIPQHHYTSLEKDTSFHHHDPSTAVLDTPALEVFENSESDELYTKTCQENTNRVNIPKLDNLEEEEDRQAFEDMCNLRGLPHATCLQHESDEDANHIFFSCSGRGK